MIERLEAFKEASWKKSVPIPFLMSFSNCSGCFKLSTTFSYNSQYSVCSNCCCSLTSAVRNIPHTSSSAQRDLSSFVENLRKPSVGTEEDVSEQQANNITTILPNPLLLMAIRFFSYLLQTSPNQQIHMQHTCMSSKGWSQ